MSSQFSISEQLLSAGRDQQLNMLPNNCLKRKLEAAGRNGFASTEYHEMGFQEHECSLKSEKRQRFSDHSTQVYDVNRQEMCTNGGLNYLSTVNNGDICPSIVQNGNSVGADSLLQNNLECHISNGGEENTENMDFECETVDTNGCPPNSNDESSPTKGSPAREYLQKHRPEYQMHCIPHDKRFTVCGKCT
ncbi:hypothetical protein ACROYT_G015882 [Oculina patagonica]